MPQYGRWPPGRCARRKNADRLPAGDGFELVLNGVHQRPVGRAAAVGPGIACRGRYWSEIVKEKRHVRDRGCER